MTAAVLGGNEQASEGAERERRRERETETDRER